MPRLQGIQSQTQAGPALQGQKITADDLGSSRGMMALSQGIQEASQVVFKREEQNEVSDATAAIAKANSAYSTAWRERISSAEPGDDTIADGFLEEYDDGMSKIGEKYNTPAAQLYIEKSRAEMRGHFEQSARAGQAELMGLKARQDYTVSVNSLSSALVNDPSSFKLNEKLHNDGLDAQVASGRLTSAAAIQLKQQGLETLAKSTIRGWIDLNPEEAKAPAKKWGLGYLPRRRSQAADV